MAVRQAVPEGSLQASCAFSGAGTTARVGPPTPAFWYFRTVVLRFPCGADAVSAPPRFWLVRSGPHRSRSAAKVDSSSPPRTSRTRTVRKYAYNKQGTTPGTKSPVLFGPKIKHRPEEVGGAGNAAHCLHLDWGDKQSALQSSSWPQSASLRTSAPCYYRVLCACLCAQSWYQRCRPCFKGLCQSAWLVGVGISTLIICAMQGWVEGSKSCASWLAPV